MSLFGIQACTDLAVQLVMFVKICSDFQTFVNLFKANFGPGFLALPLAVSRAGIVVSVLQLASLVKDYLYDTILESVACAQVRT